LWNVDFLSRSLKKISAAALVGVGRLEGAKERKREIKKKIGRESEKKNLEAD
jgi:hypothetical protein